MLSSFKFIQKLWSLHLKFLEKIKINCKENNDNKLDKITNLFIKNVSENLKNFAYNKIIANLHETYNQLFSEIEKNYTSETLIENYKKILIVMMPIIPHFANECFENIEKNKNISWPQIDEKILIKNSAIYVIQINGKKRTVLQEKKDITEDELINQLTNIKELDKYIKGKEIKKKIFVPNKLLNIII